MPGYSKADIVLLKRFGVAVKARRDELTLSQEELAERAGLHRTYISGIEQGRRNLSLLNIVKLAQALGMEPAALLERLKSNK